MHKVKHLVLCCSDYRFHPKVSAFIQEQCGTADLLALPGASKTLLDDESKNVVLSYVRMLVELHGIETVYLIDHRDCGAYGGSKSFASEKTGEENDAETGFHSERLKEASEVISEHLPSLKVKAAILDFDKIKELY